MMNKKTGRPKPTGKNEKKRLVNNTIFTEKGNQKINTTTKGEIMKIKCKNFKTIKPVMVTLLIEHCEILKRIEPNLSAYIRDLIKIDLKGRKKID